MVIDFSRLNNSPAVTGGVRSNTATGSAPKAGETSEAPQTASGEAVHLSQEAQQLQKISDKLRDQPEVNSARVAQLKQASPTAAIRSMPAGSPANCLISKPSANPPGR